MCLHLDSLMVISLHLKGKPSTSIEPMCLNKILFILSRTQFEIECRSCGQSMTSFRFFSCGGQNNFTGCHSFFCYVPFRKLTKKMEKMSKINRVVVLH